MANKTVYVDGTTSTGHYATLQAAITGEVAANANLVSMAGVLNIEISLTSADTTPVDITGFTVNASYYVNIYTTAGARHAGKWDTSKYRLEVTGDVKALRNQLAYTRITGVQVKVTSTANGQVGYGVVNDNGGGVVARACIVQMVSNHSSGYSTGFISVDGTTFINCVSFQTGSQVATTSRCRGFDLAASGSILNCTASGFLHNYYSTSGTIVCKNCISQASVTAGYSITTSTGSDYNLSDRADAVGSTVYNSKTLTFVNAASGDFHLAAGDTDAIDKGTDLSGTFTDDIDGTTRSGTWDLGADEYAGGGGGGGRRTSACLVA